MGELHLEIIVDRLKREYGVEVHTGKPQVVYKETVMSSGQAHVKFDREIHDVRHIGEVTLQVEPGTRGSGFAFHVASDLEASVDTEIIAYVEQGAKEATLAGVLAGNEVVDISVTLSALGPDLDSMTGLGLKVASSQASKEACVKASPVLLEPYMKVEVVAPEEFVGEVIADLNSRRGRVEEVSPRRQDFRCHCGRASGNHVRLFHILTIHNSRKGHIYHAVFALRCEVVSSIQTLYQLVLADRSWQDLLSCV